MVIRVYVAFPPQAHVHEQRPSGHTSMLDVVQKANTHTLLSLVVLWVTGCLWAWGTRTSGTGQETENGSLETWNFANQRATNTCWNIESLVKPTSWASLWWEENNSNSDNYCCILTITQTTRAWNAWCTYCTRQIERHKTIKCIAWFELV